jgi:hypothetical protein
MPALEPEIEHFVMAISSMCRHRYSCAPIGWSHEAPRVHRAVGGAVAACALPSWTLIWLHPTTALALFIGLLVRF